MIETNSRERFVLRPPVPVRAYAIASGASVVGAVLVVCWAAVSWPAVVGVLGIVLLVLAVALAVAAAVLAARLRVACDLGPHGITVERAGQRRSYAWSEVRSVRQSGPRLLLGTPDGDLAVPSGRGAADPTFGALQRALTSRLDADRGYRQAP